MHDPLSGAPTAEWERPLHPLAALGLRVVLWITTGALAAIGLAAVGDHRRRPAR